MTEQDMRRGSWHYRKILWLKRRTGQGMAEKNKAAGEAFLAENKKKERVLPCPTDSNIR